MNEKDLTEGMDAQQGEELGDLRGVEKLLMSYEAPEPDRSALLQRLKPLLAPEPIAAHPPLFGIHYWLWLARSQISLLDGPFWWASGLLLGLGILLCTASGGAAAVAFALVSPALAVAGVSYIFRPTARSLREMELLSAVRPLEMLYARLVMLFTYDAVLLLVLLLVGWSQGLQITFVTLARLLLIWFGPMIGLTGLALYTTIRWKALAGMIIPLASWFTLILLGWREINPQMASPIGWDALLRFIQQSNLLAIASLVALILGICLLWLAGDVVQREWST